MWTIALYIVFYAWINEWQTSSPCQHPEQAQSIPCWCGCVHMYAICCLFNSTESIPCFCTQSAAFSTPVYCPGSDGRVTGSPPNPHWQNVNRNKNHKKVKLERCGGPIVCVIVSVVRWGNDIVAPLLPPFQWHLQTPDIDPQSIQTLHHAHWWTFRACPRSWICVAYWSSMKCVQYQTF